MTTKTHDEGTGLSALDPAVRRHATRPTSAGSFKPERTWLRPRAGRVRLFILVGLLLLVLPGCSQNPDDATPSAPAPTAASPYVPIRPIEEYVLSMDGATKDAFCADIAAKGLMRAAQEFAEINNARPREVYTLFQMACPEAPDRPSR